MQRRIEPPSPMYYCCRQTPGSPLEKRDWSRIGVFSGADAAGVAPLVSIVNATNTGRSDNLGRGCRPGLDFAWFKGVLFQRQLAAIPVMVRDSNSSKEVRS